MSIDWLGGLDISTLSSLVIPLIISLLKYVWERLPKWTIPIVAGMMGIIFQFLISISTGTSAQPIYGVLIGLLGVGIREFLVQIGRKVESKSY